MAYYIFFYSNGQGGGAINPPADNLPGNPPQGNQPIVPHTIAILDNQTGNIVDPSTLTDAQRLDLLDRADRLRNAGRLSRADHQQILNNILPPAPSYEPSPSIDSSTTVNPSPATIDSLPPVNTSAEIVTPSTENSTSSTRLTQELNRYFPINGENSTASGSGSSSVNPSTEVTAESPRPIPEIEVIPASPVERPDSPLGDIERPSSPAESTYSSETVTAYIGPDGIPRLAIRRRY